MPPPADPGASGESDAERHLERLQRGPARLSSVSLVEAAIVVEARQGADAARDLGDCFSYAVARLAGLPLLYTGDDFAQTDLAAAL